MGSELVWPGFLEDSHRADFCSVPTFEAGPWGGVAAAVGVLATNSCGEHKQLGLQSPWWWRL